MPPHAQSAPTQNGPVPPGWGSLTDFFGGSKRAASATQQVPGGFMPINALSPYTNGRWTIKARVVAKGDIRKFTNSRGEGQLFKIDMADQSGEISATFFGKAVDIFYNSLRQGQVYTFTRGQVKMGNPRFDRTEHVLTFEEHANIEPAEEDQAIPGPGMSCDSGLLRDVEAIPITAISPNTSGRWKIKARVLTKGDIRKFTNSRGEGQFFKIDLADQSGQISATFFGSAVERFYPILRQGEIYAFSRGQVKAGNPRYDRTEHVLSFAENSTIEAAGEDLTIPGVSYKSIEAIKEEDLGLGPPPSMGQSLDPNGPRSIHKHQVLATVAGFPSDRMPCYPSCPEAVGATSADGQDRRRACQKKVTEEGPGIWRCSMGHMCQQPVWRYLCRVQIMDHTGTIEVQLFDQVAQKFFGCDAGQCAQAWQSSEREEVEALSERMLWRRAMFRLRSQKEVWQEVERVKYMVDDATVSTGPDIGTDARTMLRDIYGSLGLQPPPRPTQRTA